MCWRSGHLSWKKADEHLRRGNPGYPGVTVTPAERPLRILVLNQYFPPDASATAPVLSDAVQALAEAGHEVTLIAGRPSYQPTRRDRWRLVTSERRGRITVRRVGSFAFSRRRMLGRVANYLSYLALALLWGIPVRRDLVLTMTDPPLVAVVGAILAAVWRVPFVYNIQDLHPEMAVAAGLVRPGPLVRAWGTAHNWALLTARRVIVLGDDMRRRVIQKGVASDRIVVVRVGALLPADVPLRSHPVTREIRCGFPFVVLHAGNLGFAGAWATLLEAAQMFERESAGLVFVGDGAAATEIRRRAAGLSNVKLLAYRTVDEVPYVLQAGDLHVVTVRQGLEGLVVPSKLYPILAAGRPVLAVAPEESDVAAIVRRAACGWVADPDDPDAVAAAVREAMHDRVELAARGRRARDVAPEFDRSLMLRQFVRAVESPSVG